MSEAGLGSAGGSGRARRWHALYPDLYVWYILASSLDIIVTNTIIHRFGGSEVNELAARLIERFGNWGLVGLKFSTVVLVVAICETVGRRRRRVGLALAWSAIVISAFPVGWGILQVWAWAQDGAPPPPDPESYAPPWPR